MANDVAAAGDLSDYEALHRIMTRRMSVRRLKTDPIPDDYVDKILEAGRWAMSGANSQPWEYLVIKDPRKKKELYDAFQDTNMEFVFWMEQMRVFELRHPAFQVKGDTLEDAWYKIRHKTESKNRPWHEAPVVIVVLGDGRRQWGTVNGAMTFGRHASHLTDGLANTSTHMQLAIASLGLGSHWGTVHIQEPLKRVLGVPDLIEVYLIISIGYPDITHTSGSRRDLKDIVHRETYDMSKYMSNKDILDYLYQLRGKTMGRYHLKDSLLPGSEDAKKS
jgi:nitroreductase